MAISPLSEWLPEWFLDSLIPLREEASIWLVGGALRDKFLDRETFDYDFAVDGSARGIARTFANSLGAYYFDLDPERDTGRVIYVDDQNNRFVFDFARRRGSSITEDLSSRDFTINSLAIDLLTPDELIDPTKGLMDIKDGILRATSLQSFVDDPIRVLRAVRFAVLIEGRIEVDTLRSMRESIKELEKISTERIRDEVFRIFALPQPIRALRLMDHLDLIGQVFPELEALKSVPQSPTHDVDVWHHTLSVVGHLGSLFSVISPEHDPESASQLTLGEYSYRLGRFRNELNEYLDDQLSQGRLIRQLIHLAALYHDSGKLNLGKKVGEKFHYSDHEQQGAKFLRERAKKLRLSNSEADWLSGVIQGYLRPEKLTRTGKITKRAIYRFLRDTQDAAPGILLLSLAHMLAKGVDQDVWGAHIQTIRELLTAHYSQGGISAQQEPLINGAEISNELGIKPSPMIGRIKKELNEAQALGEIRSRSEAISLAREIKERIDGEKSTAE